MPAKIKYRKLICIVLINLFSSILTVLPAQSLISTNLNLNSGGAVYAADYFGYSSKYVIAGNFNSVGSQPKINIALLNDNMNLSLASDVLITSMTGEIYSIATYQNYIYIGGNFTSVNGQARKSLARFSYSISTNSWALDSWSPGLPVISDGTTQTIYDLFISGDTLFFSGDFMELSNGNDLRYDQAAIKLSNMSLLNFGSTFYFSSASSVIYNIEYYKGRVYTTGANWNYNLSLRRFFTNGTLDNSFSPSWSGSSDHTYDLEFSGDTILLVSRYAATGNNSVHAINRNTAGAVSLTLAGGGGGSIHSLAMYKRYIYFISSQTIPAPNNYLGSWNLDDSGSFDWHAYPNTAFTQYIKKNIFRVRNKLFVSGTSLTSINGNSRTGLACFCLEPHDPALFTVSDQTICPGQTNVTYSIPPVLYATGYYWLYSGSGASINGIGDTVTLTGSSNNSVSIDFGMNFTPGELMVIPFSECGETSDTLKILLSANPVPIADAGEDTSLTCSRDTISITGISSIPSVTYQWNGPNSFNSFSQSISLTTSGNYILELTDNLNGCIGRDTLLISMDTIKPDLILPANALEITCDSTSLILNGSSITSPVSTIWKNVSDGSLNGNPYTVILPGQYTFIVTDLDNDCVDSSTLIVSVNTNIPHAGVTGYGALDPSVPLDTLTCLNDTISLDAYSNTSNTNIWWTDSTVSQNFGSNLEVITSGYYYLVAIDSSNGCANHSGIYITSFKSFPDLLMPPAENLNCSSDTILLDASSSISNTSIIWYDSTGTIMNDPAAVYFPGSFYAIAARLDNGCSATDSIFINFEPEIHVSLGNDTLVCDEEVLIIDAEISGIHQGLQYSWSTGGTGFADSIQVEDSIEIILNIINQEGCTGADTMRVFIPPVPVDSILTFKQCSSDSSGQIYILLDGGLNPFSYSIDGNNFQSSPAFSGLTTGAYSITVKDSPGCIYHYSASITDSSNIPEPWFLVSTNNFTGDTIVIIDVSIPQADSIIWEFPPGALFIDDDPVMITFGDTGIFEIRMQATYGDCIFDTSKIIMVHDYDSAYSSENNQYGIKEFNLYPNPNNGEFTIEVQFYSKQNFGVIVTSLNGVAILEEVIIDSDIYSQQVNMSRNENGIYIVRVIAEYDSENKYFVISR
jgi:hypothetical protein